eukprot:1847567-Alexandrium_andersonii.AAC.1
MARLSQRVRASVEAVAAPVPRPAEGTASAPASSSWPACVGVGSAGVEARTVGIGEQMSGVGEQELPE